MLIWTVSFGIVAVLCFLTLRPSNSDTDQAIAEEQQLISDYTLKGVKGYFNSLWFDDVNSKNTAKTFMALAHTVPVVGERCKCFKLEFVNGQPKLIAWHTSTVNEVFYIGNNIYRVITHDSTYIVQVLKV